ncbi:MAG: phosphoenolpyruvate synthase [Betaproteobacteria bacterium]|nr:phosphoenolpyruvate synthase [Betaproteobacteria bacterium]
MSSEAYVLPLDRLRMADVARVGGKNASLGEMISQLEHLGVRVPGGFATTAGAYHEFLSANAMARTIDKIVTAIDVDDVKALAEAGARIRKMITAAPFPARLEQEIRQAYAALAHGGSDDLSFAVRSSATAEDLPDASFAGQQESFLNIHGIDNLLEAIKHVFASLYNDRAIAYRVHKGFAHAEVGLSAGVQRMVRSDLAASGVMFSLDTESGFDQVVFITSSYGLGETVVQGAVNPDEFYVYKPALNAARPAILRRTLGSKLIKMVFADSRAAGRSVRTLEVDETQRRRFSISDAQITELAKFAVIIEKHYGRHMDIEWGRDGIDGKLYILQARPETVEVHTKAGTQRRYRIKERSEILVTGRAIGNRVGTGPVRLVADASEMSRVRAGDVLVTDMTDPDWEPVMKRASAIVTNRGGRTCHAAIIARELGIPAVVGCADATRNLREDDEVTVSCAEGDTGYVYRGKLDVEVLDLSVDAMPKAPVKIYMNVGNPELAFDFQRLPNAGVGLARLEFIIARMIGIHPQAVLAYPNLPPDLKRDVEARSASYSDPKTFYLEKLVEGIATLGAAFYPKPVIVRLSDFKSNEYSSLLGGQRYEPHEENPMLGFRGASRYIDPGFKECFQLECQAMKKVRDEMGLTNVEIMVPFVRTTSEAKQVVALLEQNGLKRGENGLRLIMMCEIPSNALLADAFLEYFDGYSIGSNDMTQLTLGVDRDSGIVAGSFDERDPAVKAMLHLAIDACKKKGKYIGICGQGPSDHPDFAKWLVEEGIDTISMNPDTVVETWLYLAKEAHR